MPIRLATVSAIFSNSSFEAGRNSPRLTARSIAFSLALRLDLFFYAERVGLLEPAWAARPYPYRFHGFSPPLLIYATEAAKSSLNLL
jgi:hypothetical protein